MSTHDSTSLHQESPTLTVHHNGRVEQMTYQEVFAEGHRLWLTHNYPQARTVFSHLAGITNRGPKAHILWAHCCAMMEDYSECSRVLAEGLPSSQYGNAAIDLHDTFVMWKCGMWLDVKKGLEKIVAEHQELPTPCLILGEFLMQVGNTIRPPELLEQARDRDTPNGAVAMIACEKLVEAKKLAGRKLATAKPPTRKKKAASPETADPRTSGGHQE